MRITRGLIVAGLLALAGCGGNHQPDETPPQNQPTYTKPPVGTGTQLALLESTDLHTNVLSYDYFRLAEDKSLGFERLATLIKQARAEFPNSMLLDNGDTIQGTVLSDYQALISPVPCTQELAIYKAMDAIGYDAAGVGNHEFNYGLGYLSQVTNSHFQVDVSPAPTQEDCSGPKFPIVLANVLSAKTDAPLFKPYVILNKQVSAKDAAGNPITAEVRVGIIAFTPPTIMSWDKRWLDGKIYTAGLKETAEKYVPEMKARGADLIVAISHGGLDNTPYSPTMENGSYYLSQVPGIDALLLGHSHQIFPDPRSTQPQFNLPGVDKVAGTVNGVPAVMANLWGKHLGVIVLDLTFDGTNWQVNKDKTKVEARAIQTSDSPKTYVDPDPEIAQLVQPEHEATIAYVKTPVGTTDFRMTTYFADVGEVGAIQIVNQAQADYVKKYVEQNLPQYASLPVLSVSAPFKSGFAGGADFTDVSAGNLAINNAADLYLYPNTVYAVKVTGAGLKAWLEKAAGRFRQIDPTKTEPQALVDSAFPGYNFDMPSDAELTYQIDVTQPLNSRIVALTWKGNAVKDTDPFIVATNNYRGSGGGGFPGLDGTNVIYASPDANRDVLINYIKSVGSLTRASNGSARSWTFAKVTTAGPVTFTSAQDKLAVAADAGLNNVTLLQADDGSGKGLAVYAIDLSK